MIMRSSSSLRTAVLAAAGALLVTSAQAGPMPISVATMKSVVDPVTTEVRWGYGYRGGLAYRGYGYRGYGYRGYGYRRLGYGVAGAVVGAGIASAYYGSGYYGGGYYGGGYPAYSSEPYYGYAGGYRYVDDSCLPSGPYSGY